MPECYKAVCQYDVNACDKCKHDMECYHHFLEYMLKREDTRK